MLEWLKRQIFGAPDPTRDWKREAGLRLRFDLDSASLGDAELGSPFERLQRLGRSDRKAATFGEDGAWPDLGIAATHDDATRIVEFQIYFLEGVWLSFQPFAGEIVYRGEKIDLREFTLPAFQGRFGEPYWSDEDEDGEILLFYEFPGREWQVEFSPGGLLSSIIVTSEPLLADETQRRNYSVTKPWPPAFAA